AKRGVRGADGALGLPLTVESVEPDAALAIEVSTDDPGDSTEDGPASFTVTVFENDIPVETFPNLDFGAGDTNVKTVINKTSTKIKVDVALDKAADLSSQLEMLK